VHCESILYRAFIIEGLQAVDRTISLQHKDRWRSALCRADSCSCRCV